MSEKLLNEKNIKNYLLDHPKFFKNNKDLLANLKFTHENIGSSTSLLEKQNFLLRKKLNLEKNKAKNLIFTANENERKYEKLTFWFSKLFFLKKNGRVKYLLNSLISCFNLDAASLIIFDENLLAKYKLPRKSIYVNKEIKTKITSLYFPLVTNLASECNFWFRSMNEGDVLKKIDNPKTYKSFGVIPVRFPEKKHLCGLIVLASSEKEKFSPELDTFFLSKMGIIISAFIFNKEIIVSDAKRNR